MKLRSVSGRVAPTAAGTFAFRSGCRRAFLARQVLGHLHYRVRPVPNHAHSLQGTNNRASITELLLHQIIYSYNAPGQWTGQTDRDGRVRNFGYDAVGRQTSETWLNSLSQAIYTATYTFDAAGNQTGASDSNSVYAYGYDAAQRLTSVDNLGTPGVPHVVLNYGYDVYNNRVSLNDNVGGAVSFAFDADHRLTTLQVYTGSPSMTLDATVTFGYDAASRLTGITRSNTGIDTITSAYSYDNANRLTNITHTDTTKVPALTLASYTYGYDAANQLTSYSGPDGSLTYGYDVDGQLTSVTGARTENFTYDKNGNRTMAGYTTGAGNRLTSDGAYNYTYDNEGDLLTQTRISDGQLTNYTWDYRNRLTEVVVKNSAGTVLNDEKFTYDVNNNRIGVMLNGVQQSWTVFDGANPYLDFTGAGTLTQRYLTNPNGLSQFYARVNGSNVVNWYLTDNINSIRQIVDTSGNVLDALTYSAFGNILSQTNAANAPRLMYAGGAYDSLTGNYQFDARYYNPSTGRFQSQDPLSFAARNTNLYVYTFNHPASASDPSGLFSWPGAGGGALGGAAYGAGTGAIVGTFIFPGVGTGIGAGIGAVGGAVLGFFGGGFLTEPVANWLLGPNVTLTKEEQFSFGMIIGAPLGILAGFAGPAAYAFGAGLIKSTYSKLIGSAFNPADFIGKQAITSPNLPAGTHTALVVDGKVYVARFHNIAWELAGRTGTIQYYGAAEIDAAGKVVRLFIP